MYYYGLTKGWDAHLQWEPEVDGAKELKGIVERRCLDQNLRGVVSKSDGRDRGTTLQQCDLSAAPVCQFQGFATKLPLYISGFLHWIFVTVTPLIKNYRCAML